MIKEITVANFKALGTQQKVPLAPITLIYGPNSGGKSSLIQSLLTLTQTAAWLPSFHSNASPHLITKGELIDSGSFASAIHRHDLARQIILGLKVNDEALRNTRASGQKPYKQKFVFGIDFGFSTTPETPLDHQGKVSSATYSAAGDMNFELPFHDNKETENQKNETPAQENIENIEIKNITSLSLKLRRNIFHDATEAANFGHDYDNSNNKHLNAKIGRMTLRHFLGQPEFLENYSTEALVKEALRKKINLKLETILSPSLVNLEDIFTQKRSIMDLTLLAVDQIETAIQIISNSISAHLSQIRYLGPLRSHPERFYIATNSAPNSVGVHGQNLMPMLIAEQNQSDPDGSLVDAINIWFKQLEIPYQVKIRRISDAVAGDLHILELLDLLREVPVSPRDVGFGFSQLLPIIVEGLISTRSPTKKFPILCVEQPEIHLHPRLQAHVADFLIYTAKGLSGDPDSPTGADSDKCLQWIVETHSEALLVRIQRRIREKKIDARDVSVLYVAPDANGASKVLSLRLDEDGDFIDEWPGGFFEEVYREKFASR